jgi:hypothetical protein
MAVILVRLASVQESARQRPGYRGKSPAPTAAYFISLPRRRRGWPDFWSGSCGKGGGERREPREPRAPSKKPLRSWGHRVGVVPVRRRPGCAVEGCPLKFGEGAICGRREASRRDDASPGTLNQKLITCDAPMASILPAQSVGFRENGPKRSRAHRWSGCERWYPSVGDARVLKYPLHRVTF